MTQAIKVRAGGEPSYSPDGSKIVFDSQDSNGIYQLWLMNSDATNQICLSCASVSPAPKTTNHKTSPTWSPDGKWIIVTGERDNWVEWANFLISEQYMNGLWGDAYAVAPDGQHWYKLTNTGLTTDGVLTPRLSPNGTQMTWSRLMANPSTLAPFGVYHLMIADFATINGAPSIQNARDISPPGGQFFEAHGFTPDGSSVVFTTDLGTIPGNSLEKNIYQMNLASGVLTDLTGGRAAGQWNEHARFTSHGLFSWMSSLPYWVPGGTDVWMRNPDGSISQLTHFNTPGFVDSQSSWSTVGGGSFSPNGSQYALGQQIAFSYPSRYLWILTFAGSCG